MFVTCTIWVLKVLKLVIVNYCKAIFFYFFLQADRFDVVFNVVLKIKRDVMLLYFTYVVYSQGLSAD